MGTNNKRLALNVALNFDAVESLVYSSCTCHERRLAKKFDSDYIILVHDKTTQFHFSFNQDHPRNRRGHVAMVLHLLPIHGDGDVDEVEAVEVVDGRVRIL